MKAYTLSIRDDPDQGDVVVFANTVKEARKLIYTEAPDLMWESWLDVQAHRCKNYDGMENLDAAHLALEQWKSGWRWFDMNYPDPDSATDSEFLDWYKRNFD